MLVMHNWHLSKNMFITFMRHGPDKISRFLSLSGSYPSNLMPRGVRCSGFLQFYIQSYLCIYLMTKYQHSTIQHTYDIPILEVIQCQIKNIFHFHDLEQYLGAITFTVLQLFFRLNGGKSICNLFILVTKQFVHPPDPRTNHGPPQRHLFRTN